MPNDKTKDKGKVQAQGGKLVAGGERLAAIEALLDAAPNSVAGLKAALKQIFRLAK